MKQLIFWISFAAVLTGCGLGRKEVTLRSRDFSTSGVASMMKGTLLASLDAGTLGGNPRASFAVIPATNISEFKVCMRKLELEGEGDVPVEDEDGDTEVEVEVGLVDLSDGMAKEWGKVSLPLGVKLEEIEIKAKVDPELCGVAYSVSFNGIQTTDEVEFEWEFEPMVELDQGSNSIALSFSAIAAALRQAADAGILNSSTLKDQIELVLDKASEDEED